MKMMKFGYILGLCFWAMPLYCMDDYIADELAQERAEQIKKSLGAELCKKILSAWSLYERRLLVTMLHERQWPAPRRGEPILFAHDKKVHRDFFSLKLDNKVHTIYMTDFRILAELHRVPRFDDFNKEMIKFDDLRNHFVTEDEIWEQLDRQLTRGK